MGTVTLAGEECKAEAEARAAARTAVTKAAMLRELRKKHWVNFTCCKLGPGGHKSCMLALSKKEARLIIEQHAEDLHYTTTTNTLWLEFLPW